MVEIVEATPKEFRIGASAKLRSPARTATVTLSILILLMGFAVVGLPFWRPVGLSVAGHGISLWVNPPEITVSAGSPAGTLFYEYANTRDRSAGVDSVWVAIRDPVAAPTFFHLYTWHILGREYCVSLW